MSSPTPVKLPQRAPSLGAGALKSAAYERGNYFCTVPDETTLEQILTPAFWQNHIVTLSSKPFPVIEVMRRNGTLEVWLRVLSTKPGMAVVRPIFPAIVTDAEGKSIAAAAAMRATDQAIAMPPGYKYAHVPNGAERGHMVRLPNGDVMVKGGATKAEVAGKAWLHYRESMGLPPGGPLTDEEANAVAAKLRDAG